MKTLANLAGRPSCARTTLAGLFVLIAASGARAQAPCNLISMAGGAGHTLALTADGNVLAWGMNAYGELATGNRSFAVEAPVPVIGVSGILSLAAGEHFSLALGNDGRVYSWGENSYGALGNGSTTDVPTAVPVSGISAVVAIAAGSHHAVALRSDGSVWAWGGTWAGQYASPGLIYQTSPAPTNLTGIVQIAAGGTSTLALDDSGSVFAMGGLAGPGNVGPTLVANLDTIIAIAAGGDRNGRDHGLALRADGTVWSWGNNEFGQLGDNSTSARAVPVPVFGLGPAAAIAAGGYHSAARTAGDLLYTWGRNDFGQLGNGNYTDSLIPAAVPALGEVASISLGLQHTMVTFRDGLSSTWGWGGTGQLGRLAGMFSTASVPVTVGGGAAVIAASTRGDSTPWLGDRPMDALDHTLLLTSDGQVWVSGSNRHGQLGTGDTRDRNAPTALSGLDAVSGISAGARHSLALNRDGTVLAWGDNGFGQLGDGSTSSSLAPVPVAGLADVVIIAAGERDSLAITLDGSVWSWGWFSGSATPRLVPGLSGTFVSIAAGAKFFLALRADGTVWSWGWNDFGQLGDGSNAPFADIAVPVSGLANIEVIAAGGSHALAIQQNGDVWAWGNNQNGQLGNGGLARSPVPLRIAALAGVRAIAAGSDHSLAADGTGAVFAWGRNFAGESGAGLTGDGARKVLPVAVNGPAGAILLAAGSTTSLAWTIEGDLDAWGWNGVGQLATATPDRSADAGAPAIDVRPAPQGNILMLARRGDDVVLDYSGGSAGAWTVYRDTGKAALGTRILRSPVVTRSATDDGAMARPEADFYTVTGLSSCTFTPEG